MYKMAHKLVHNDNRCLKPPNRKTCKVSSALPDFPNPSPQKQLQELLLLQTVFLKIIIINLFAQSWLPGVYCYIVFLR